MLFLTMRALHVVLAGAWFGAVVFTSLYLGPAVGEAGPAGGQVMTNMMRRGLHKYMASMGDPAFPSSHRGMAISTGALTGIIALILGGSMIGASAKKMVALHQKMASLPDGAERAAAMQTMKALGSRMELFSKIVSALLLISMVTMALAHLV